MKRLIVMLACVLTIGAATAQEKKGGFMAEAGLGFSRFGNYSPVSVFDDPTEVYSMIPSEHISLGYHFGNHAFIGLTVGSRGANTSFRELDENVFDLDILVDIRRFVPLGHRFELEYGAAVGLMLHGNAYEFGGDLESVARKGFSCHIEMGVNYNLGDKTYVGLHAQMPYFANIKNDDVELPAAVTAAGYTVTDASQMSGCSLHASFGIRF